MEFDEFGEPQDTAAHIVETLLTVAAVGVIVTSVAVAPGIAIALKALAPNFRFEPNAVGQAIRRLTKRGLITRQQTGDQVTITITPRGRERLDQYIVRDIALPTPPDIWDQQWRIVIFDVPEERKHLRAIFRRKLKQLGFVYLQRSAWIYPHPCEQVLTTLIDRLGIGAHVHVAVVNVLSSDAHFRGQFAITQPATPAAPALAIAPTDSLGIPPVHMAATTPEDDLIPITELS